jgi:signal transduction histidine kinase
MQLDDTVMALLQRDGTYEAMSDLDGLYSSTRYVVAEPLQSWDGEMIGYVFVSYEGDEFFGMWRGFALMFVLIAFGVLLLAILFEYYNAKRLARPLHEMAEAANRFAHGDYAARVTYEEADEIGTLADAFNAMAQSLEQNENRRREFIANVSHELRTPMTSISGFADGILDGTIPPQEERRYLETISSETKRLSRLVRSMLDMSRLQGGDPSLREGRFDLGEMVVQTILSFEERVDKKRLNMDLHMPEDRLFVRGDVDSLTRVVYNLVDNAVKFASEGTDLTISLWKEGGKAYTCVQDVGQEIPREELSRIFERFHKADHSRSQDKDGVGLGLYMVRQILAAHDQDIFVTSENGVTAFTFTLALAEND